MKPSIVRLGTLLLLFDVYLTWARIEKQTVPNTLQRESNLGKLAQLPIILQYLFFCEFTAALLLSKLNRLTRCPCSNTLHTFYRSIPW